MQRCLIDGGSGEREAELPAVNLTFSYLGTELRPGDECQRVFAQGPCGLVPIPRDRERERRVQCILEVHGALESDWVEDVTIPLGSEADYLLPWDTNIHARCSFTASVVPKLRALGYEVSFDPDYPYQVVGDDLPWVSRVEPTDEKDWFALRLGFEIDGKLVDVLPALLDLIREAEKGVSLQELFRLPARHRAVTVGLHRYVTLPPQRFQSILELLLELYRGDVCSPERLVIHGCQGHSLAKIPGMEPLGGAGALPHRPRPEPASLAMATGAGLSLRPYQEDGVRWLQGLRRAGTGGLLADDMGLGKTLQVLTHLALDHRAGHAKAPALVVVPTSLVGNWQAEIQRFFSELSPIVYHGPNRSKTRARFAGAPLVLTTYSVLVRDADVLSAQEYSCVVLDEIQAIKNPASLAAQLLGQFPSCHRIGLSGTPVENHLEELWSLFHFLVPELLGSRAAFRACFRQPIEQRGDPVRLAALRARISPFLLRRTKEQVARDLPPKTWLSRPVELSGEQRDLYESIRLSGHAEVRRAIRHKGVAASAVTILDALLKLRQVCCDPRLLNIPARERVKTSAKGEAFFELLETQLSEGRRVLVFSQFVRMLTLLSEGLLLRGIRHTTLTGATVDRQRRVEAFQRGEVDVFLVSLKAGGTGLNLTRADTVIHYDPWWNAAAQEQATDRAHRIGQVCPVFVFNLVIAGSVEENMLALQRRKHELSDALLGHNPSVLHLDADEIEDLFAPLAD